MCHHRWSYLRTSESWNVGNSDYRIIKYSAVTYQHYELVRKLSEATETKMIISYLYATQ